MSRVDAMILVYIAGVQGVFYSKSVDFSGVRVHRFQVLFSLDGGIEDLN